MIIFQRPGLWPDLSFTPARGISTSQAAPCWRFHSHSVSVMAGGHWPVYMLMYMIYECRPYTSLSVVWVMWSTAVLLLVIQILTNYCYTDSWWLVCRYHSFSEVMFYDVLIFWALRSRPMQLSRFVNSAADESAGSVTYNDRHTISCSNLLVTGTQWQMERRRVMISRTWLVIFLFQPGAELCR